MKKISLLSPIDAVDEAQPLIEAGADEFYCGILLNGREIGSPRCNDKAKSNLCSFEDAEALCGIIHKAGRKIFLVLNSPALDERDIEDILRSVESFVRCGIDGFIVQNLRLLESLKEMKLYLVASSLLEVKNPESADFLRQFNIRKIVLDRQVTLSDLASIVPRFPEIGFEAFVMSSACRSLDSYCRLTETTGCHACTKPITLRESNRHLSQEELHVIAQRLRMPLISCGICALRDFARHGIESVKIVGRSFPLLHKLQLTRVARKAIDFDSSIDDGEYLESMYNIFYSEFGFACDRKYCYYPHFH